MGKQLDATKLFFGGLKRGIVKWELEEALHEWSAPPAVKIYMVPAKDDVSPDTAFVQYGIPAKAEHVRTLMHGANIASLSDDPITATSSVYGSFLKSVGVFVYYLFKKI